MLDLLLAWKYSFWTIAFLIVALDSMVLLAPGEFAYSFGRDRRPRVRIAAMPFLLRARELMFAPAAFFARPYFVSSINAADAGKTQIAELRALAIRQRFIGTCSVLAIVLAFVAGPILTAEIDIGHALLAVLPLVYLNALFALVAFAVARNTWKISPQSLAFIAFEFIVCPFLVVNLNKRLAYRAAAVPNTFQLIGGDDGARSRILANLEYHDIPLAQMNPSQHG